MLCQVFSLVVTMVVLPFAAGAQLGDMAGSVPPQLPSVERPAVCQHLQALNDENQKKWLDIQKARERRAPVREFCHLLRNSLFVEAKIVSLLEVIEWYAQTCGAPPDFLKRLKAHYKDAWQTGSGFCEWPPGDYWRPGEFPRFR